MSLHRCYTNCANCSMNRWSNCCENYCPTMNCGLPKRKNFAYCSDGCTMRLNHYCATCLMNYWSSHCVTSRWSNCCENYCPMNYEPPKTNPYCDAPPHHYHTYDFGSTTVRQPMSRK